MPHLGAKLLGAGERADADDDKRKARRLKLILHLEQFLGRAPAEQSA